MTTCLGRVSRVRSVCLMLALSASLVAVGSECLASPFQLVFRNDSDATLIPYRVAKTVDGDRVRVADPSGAIAPGAEVEVASTGFDPIFFDPESRRALLLDTRSGDRPSVLAAVFEYETTPATDGSRSPVRKEVSRTAFAMNTVRTNVLVLSADGGLNAATADEFVGQIERVYHPDRLKYPMRRVGPRGSGQLQRVSWDEMWPHLRHD